MSDTKRMRSDTTRLRSEMRRMRGTAAVLLGGILLAGVAAAEPTVAEDLFAVITLRGKPCGKVVEYRKRAEGDYDVTCKSGDRYRVYTKNDRVVIEERPRKP